MTEQNNFDALSNVTRQKPRKKTDKKTEPAKAGFDPFNTKSNNPLAYKDPFAGLKPNAKKIEEEKTAVAKKEKESKDFLDTLTQSIDPITGAPKKQEFTMETKEYLLKKKAKEKESAINKQITEAEDVKRLKKAVLKNNDEFKKAYSIIENASIIDEDFEKELDDEVKGLDLNNYYTLKDEKQQALSILKKQNDQFSDSDVNNLAANIYKENQRKAKIYSQRFDAFEALDNYDTDVKDFIKELRLNESKIADLQKSKINVQKDYSKQIIETELENIIELQSKLKPKNYKFASQEEVDTENKIIEELNSRKINFLKNAKQYDILSEEENKLSDVSTSFKDEVSLYGKEWGWANRTGLKAWKALSDFGGNIAGGTAWILDSSMPMDLIAKDPNYFGNIISEMKKGNQEFFESKLPETRDVFNIESFGEHAADVVLNTAPFVATVMAAPETIAPEAAGFVTGFVAGSGDKYTSMLSENKYGSYNKLGELVFPEYSQTQLKSVPALFGVFEGGSEVFGARAINRMANTIKKATSTELEVLRQGMLKTSKQKAIEFSENLLQNWGEEIPAELANNFFQNATDKILLNKDTDILDNSFDVFTDTAIVSTLFGTAPAIAGVAYKPFIPTSNIVNLMKNNDKIDNILKNVDYKSLSKEEKIVIDGQIKDLNDKSIEIINKTTGLFASNSKQELIGIYEASKNLTELRKQAITINNSTTIPQYLKNSSIDALNEKYKEKKAEYEQRLSRAYDQEKAYREAFTFLSKKRSKADVKKAAGVNAKILLESKTQTGDVLYLNTEEAITTYLSDKDNALNVENEIKNINNARVNSGKAALTSAEKNLYTRAIAAAATNRSYGQFHANGRLIINKDQTILDKKFNTGRHEILHKIVKSFEGSMGNIGQALYSFVESNNSGKKFNETNFYMRMQDYINSAELKTAYVNDKLNSTKSKLLNWKESNVINESDYNSYIKKAEDNATNEIAKINNQAWEEATTVLAESIEEGDIKISNIGKTRFDKDGNVLLDNASDVFNFIVDYSSAYSKSELSEAGKASVKGKVKGALVSNENLVSDNIKESNKLQSLYEKFNNDAKKMVNETLSKTPSGNYTSSLTSSALGQELGGIVETITKRLYDPIPLDNKEMLSRQEYKEALIGMAATMITNEFNPEKQTLDQFVSSRLNLRANSLAKELGIESTQEQGGAGFKVEINSNKTEGDDGMGFDEDFLSEEEADDLLDLEEQAAEQNKRLFPKFIEALDLTMEIDGKPIIETLNDKMKRNLSFAMKRYDEDISKNRTITPFVETLRMEMQEDMYKDFKKYINNYPGGYAQFLTDKKEVLLANYTTTYLAKHPIFRQGIEKRVGGDWVGPRKFKKDNGTIEYKWADEKGDALKIDRDNAAGRGLTSGPEFIRRNKKINDVLSTKEFVDYHFQDGGLRTKKKQNPEDAVARQLASEITLEVFQADLAENGPLSKMFEERAELLGKIVADNALAELAKDLDRGLIKESKRLEATFNAVYTDNFNTYFTNQTGYDIVKNASEMGLGSAEFDNFIKNLNIDEDIIARFIDAAISEHIYVIMEDQEIKANNLGDKYEKAISDTLGNFFKGKISSKVVRNKKGDISLTVNGTEKIIELKLNEGAQFSSMTISNVFNDKEITSSKSTKQLSLIKEALSKNKVMLTAVKKAVKEAGGKITDSGQIEFATRDERRAKWEAIRDTVYKGMIIDGDASIVMEMYADTNVDFIQIGEKGLYALNKDSETENIPMFDATMQYMIRLVPSGNKVTMRVFPLVTGMLSKSNINLEKASTIAQFIKDIDYKATKIKESKKLDEDFNKIIEETTGVEAFKEFSAIVGKRRGANKGKFRLFIPPGAEDFQGLLYDLMGKGKKGEEHQKFFMKHLVEPYTFGVNQIMRTKNAIRREYGQLMKVFPKVKSKLEKQIPSKDFTYDQAIRVYLWDKANIEIPGLTQRDQAKLVDLIKNDPELEQFSGLLSQISRQPEGWLKPGNHWDVDTILSDLNNTTEGSNRKEFLSDFVENSKEMFSDKNKNKLRAVFGNNWVDAMEDALFRMTNGTNRVTGSNKVVNAWNNWVNNSTGAIMFFNRRSAILQLLSTFNYINWSDNNPLNAAIAFANQKQYWSDFAMIFNSPMMKERRGGLQMEVSESEIANAAANSKNKAKAVMSYLLKIGFIPTQMADSFAIASGGASMYRNRVNTYLKELDEQGNKKYNQKGAEDKAFEDFARTTNESQQSADPMLISQEQAGPLGRLVLAFQNTTQQYMRLSKKSLRDLINGRGDWKVHVSKIVYYTTIQNIIFNALQSGIFALIPGFGDEDDDEFDEKGKKLTAKQIAERKQKQQEEKEGDMINGFVDGVLRGAGLYGAIAATTKNVLLKYMEVEAKEKGMKDYTPVVIDAVSISPPIGSKVRKLNQAMKGRDYNREVIEKRGYSVTYDGKLNLSPAWLSTGQAVSAVTNFPLDRMYDETNSMIEAFDTRNTGLQRTALALGWKDWTVGATNEENDLIRSTAKKEKKEAKAKENKSESNVRKRRIRKRKIRR